MAVEILSSRILNIAENELPKQSLGLEILGLDVNWGTWRVQLPNGQPLDKNAFALMIAVRRTNPNGAVVLGNQVPITTAFILETMWPSEQEIRFGVKEACNGLRQYIAAGKGAANGQGSPGGLAL